MMLPVAEAAPAKLTLFLHITGKREDGYHLLDGAVAFTELSDMVHFYPADGISLEVTGEFADALAAEKDNIVLSAVHLLKQHTDCKQGARIVLHKHIPVAAGLGGGSADAAATLRGLPRLWNVDVAQNDLHALASQLGSDVPVCLAARPAVMRGAGEALTPLALACEAWVVLVNPLVALSTQAVYRAFSGDFTKETNVPAMHSFASLAALLESTGNALQPAAVSLCPDISPMLDALAATAGCRIARMAGSGATCFGVFEQGRDAKAAALQLADTHGWWTAATKLQ